MLRYVIDVDMTMKLRGMVNFNRNNYLHYFIWVYLFVIFLTVAGCIGPTVQKQAISVADGERLLHLSQIFFLIPRTTAGGITKQYRSSWGIPCVVLGEALRKNLVLRP